MLQDNLKELVVGDEPEVGAGIAAPGILPCLALSVAAAEGDLTDRKPEAEPKVVRHAIELIGEHQLEGLLLEQSFVPELPALHEHLAEVGVVLHR